MNELLLSLAILMFGFLFIVLMSALRIINRTKYIHAPPTCSKSADIWVQIECKQAWDRYYNKLVGY